MAGVGCWVFALNVNLKIKRTSPINTDFRVGYSLVFQNYINSIVNAFCNTDNFRIFKRLAFKRCPLANASVEASVFSRENQFGKFVFNNFLYGCLRTWFKDFNEDGHDQKLLSEQIYPQAMDLATWGDVLATVLVGVDKGAFALYLLNPLR